MSRPKALKVVALAAIALSGAVAACGRAPGLPAYAPAGLSGALRAQAPANAWRYLPDMPKALARLAAASYDQQLHVVGGQGEKGPTWEHVNFRPFDLWFLDDLAPQPVVGHALGALSSGVLYLVGGEVDRRVTGATWRWSDEQGWTAQEAMPTPRSEIAMAQRMGSFYVVGGVGADGFLTGAFETYSPSLQRWSSMPPLPVPTAGGVLTALGDRLVYAGGRTARGITGATWLYDFRTRTWNQDTVAMPTPRQGAAVASDGAYMVVMGGRTTKALNPKEVCATVERYDRSQGWRSMPALPQPVELAAAAYMQEHLVLVGGLSNGMPSTQCVGMRFLMK